jgi:hypothetical protein
VSWSLSRISEGVALLAGVTIGAWWIFLAPHDSLGPFTQPFPLLSFLVWAALRFGVSGSAWTTLHLRYEKEVAALLGILGVEADTSHRTLVTPAAQPERSARSTIIEIWYNQRRSDPDGQTEPSGRFE